MDSHSMHGMDMGGSMSPSRSTNMRLARNYWYIIAALTGVWTAIRVQRAWERRRRRRHLRLHPMSIASRPHGLLSQVIATITAIARESTYSQPLFFTGPVAKHFTPLSVGKWTLLAAYWILLLSFLFSGTILTPSSSEFAYRWEKPGYRAAWVSIAQIPLIYLLSCKFNPITLLTGISYERFNWLHRWTARTVFLTVIVHWANFFAQWYFADFVQVELKMMPMVKYGFGAWAVLGWIVFSGAGFFRKSCYELFVLQHITAAAILLWLLYVHIPEYAHYHLWMAIAFVVFDWAARLVWMILRNTHALSGFHLRSPGYSARLEQLPGDVVRLTIDDADFRWRAGQHMYISFPRLGPFELHPFTIANAPSPQPISTQPLTMLIQAQTGFSRRLFHAAAQPLRLYRALLSGPFGVPPHLDHYDTVVLIACSTGISFILPLLQTLVRSPGAARRIHFHWILRSESHLQWMAADLASTTATATTLHVKLTAHITRPSSPPASLSSSPSRTAKSSDSPLPISFGRPSPAALIRPPVEAARGESAIVVCGGASIIAQTRTFVAALSDERAVHKGTGAQGVFWFGECFGL